MIDQYEIGVIYPRNPAVMARHTGEYMRRNIDGWSVGALAALVRDATGLALPDGSVRRFVSP